MVPDTRPVRQPAYRIGPKKTELMRKEVDYLLQNNLAVPSCSPWASPSLLVPKEGGKVRFCTDYRRVNLCSVPDAYPLPRVDDLIDSVGQAQLVTKLDLLHGYHQIPLTPSAQKISAFITPFGLYEYCVMPFGLRNAGSTFQRMINGVIRGIPGVCAYLDDILIVADDVEQHRTRVEMVLKSLRDWNLTVNLSKSTFFSATVTYLGHVVGNGIVRPKTANVEAILDFPVPTNKKKLQSFLGMAGFYRRFCPNFATIAYPLTQLTGSKIDFVWDDNCQKSFESLKDFLTNEPILKSPNFSLPFVLHTDACETGTGAVLLQQHDDGILHPICYYSCQLKKHQLAYSTIEKELLGIINALQKFDCYLYGVVPLVIYTDHNPLTFLQRAQHTNQRLLRWSLHLQQYPLEIRHIKGVDNILADTLSRVSS